MKLTDPDFEIVIFEDHLWHDYVRFLAAVIMNRLARTRGVKLYRAPEAFMSAPEDLRIYIQTDGEAVGNLPATVVTVPDALTLLLPRAYLALSVVK